MSDFFLSTFFALISLALGFFLWKQFTGVSRPAIERGQKQDRTDETAPRFFRFQSVQLIRIGLGAARILEITRLQLRYADEDGADFVIDLEDCARIQRSLEHAGQFPPSDDTDWTRLAMANPSFSALEVSHGCVGLRAAVDTPPWFQFLDRRRTQFQFKDYDAMQSDLLQPLTAAGWQTWDAS